MKQHDYNENINSNIILYLIKMLNVSVKNNSKYENYSHFN